MDIRMYDECPKCGKDTSGFMSSGRSGTDLAVTERVGLMCHNCYWRITIAALLKQVNHPDPTEAIMVHGYTTLEGLNKARHGQKFPLYPKSHIYVKMGQVTFHVSAPVKWVEVVDSGELQVHTPEKGLIDGDRAGDCVRDPMQ